MENNNIEIDNEIRSYFNELLLKSEISVDEEKKEKMLCFLELLHEKNKVMNLTAIRDKKGMAEKHFIDSLFLAKIIKEEEKKIIDVGTGAGFPGLVLAIYYPEKEFLLVDSVRKKIEFIKRTEIKQKLDSITIQSDLKEVITRLDSVNFSNDSILSLQPLTIENKIPSTENVLLFKIRSDVVGYYNIVKQMFQELESFTSIAKEINYSFNILNEQGLTHQEIYENLTNHIIRCTGLDSNKRLSCEIIVSFFIQNCEVYNEITK